MSKEAMSKERLLALKGASNAHVQRSPMVTLFQSYLREACDEIDQLKAKLEAAEQHVTICQRVNTEEVERRRAAEKVAAAAEALVESWDSPDMEPGDVAHYAEAMRDALRESEKP
jgi:hypothetical protein